jgi:hypothetical protein
MANSNSITVEKKVINNIIVENNKLLAEICSLVKENNIHLRNVEELLRKITINTSN